MDLIHAIVLAVVQGLNEFLPISSSAHLIIVPWLFGWEDPGLAFDAALHLGTLAAVYAYFWRDLVRMARALPRALRRPLALLRDPAPGAVENPLDLDARLALLIAVGTIPELLALDHEWIQEYFRGPRGRAAETAVAKGAEG